MAPKRALIALLASAGLSLATLSGLPSPASAAPSPLAPVSPATYAPAGCNATPATPATAQCFAEIQHKPATSSRLAPAAQAPAATALGPADIRAAYNLPDGGDGQTVAVVDALGYSTAEADLAVFRDHYGLPACTTDNGCFRKVDQTGGTGYPADDKGWAEETALDVDAVSAVCPKCHILLVEGDSASLADLAAAVDTAVRLGARYVSNSYGLSPEDAVETTMDSHYDHPGVVITASTGDKPNIPIWPSTSPKVLGVGGTTLTRADGSARGWAESAWSSGGSGCSAYEPQPQFQASLATACPRRASADVSADADPQTGLAVYDTLQLDGWQQVGGTSLSSPLVAAMYALAGPPVAGTYPVEYPYIGQAGLHDVTTGSNGSCGDVLCNAGPGWDGPTGLGTPDGVGALRLGPHGTLGGTVTSGGTGIAGVTLTLKDTAAGRTFRAVTGAGGKYSLTVAAGTYDVTSSAFGYGSTTRTGIAVADGATVTTDLVLAKVPARTVTGTVTDGSGHGYPLGATITIDGYPGGAVHTDPYTGAYSVVLPESATYALHTTPVYPGYRTLDTQLAIGTKNVRKDLAVAADASACNAPGYRYPLGADFESPDTGWTVTDHGTTGRSWQFDDTQANLTGGTGNYAAADPFDYDGTAVDADLTSPAADMTGQPGTLQFDAFVVGTGIEATAEVSTDRGATWATAWTYNEDNPIGGFEGHVSVAVPQTAGRKQVEVRFHFAGSGQTIMEVDNVHLGQCGPVTGGLVAGKITDGNTGAPVTSATVTDRADPDTSAGTDSSGFYWFFSRPAGRHGYDVTAPRYAPAVSTARTAADAVVRHDVALKAGRLAVSPGAIRATGKLGGTVSRRLTLTNTGRTAMHVSFLTQGAPTTGASAVSTGAPVVTNPGAVPDTSHGSGISGHVRAPAVTGSAWTSLPDLPTAVQDNAAGYYRGKTYSVGGITDFIGGTIQAHGYVYDPAAATWSPIADLPQPLDSPGAAFVDGTMYVVGGWGTDFAERSTVYAYHPATDKWTRVADLPAPTAAAAVATLDGKLYVIGGCVPGCASSSNAVYRYDPARNKWTRLADYPHIARWGACAGASGQVVCSGGVWDDPHAESLAATYRYDPATGRWTAGADSPEATFGATYGGANGMLQMVGGSVPGGTTNRALQYDPVADVWSDLPAALSPIIRGAGGCGMTRVGGWPTVFGPPTASAEQLPGLDGCEGDDVAWLTVSKPGVDLAPGRSATVTVRLDGSAVGAPGLHAATLFAVTDSPYDSGRVDISYQVGRH